MTILLISYFGAWPGSLAGDKFIYDFKDLQIILSHLVYIRILDRNGHLIIEGSQHYDNEFYKLNA